ncbi:MAG: O-antigen ligase family protein, partial [Halobacteriaceae archaeon]
QSLLEVGRYVIAGDLFLTTFFLLIYGVISVENTYTILSLAPLPSALGSIFAFFFSILGIQIPLLDVFLFSRGISIRASAFIFDPNYYANLLLIPLTITGYRIFVQGYNKRSNGVLFSVYSLAIFCTVSRSGLGAMTFVLVALIILYLLQKEIIKKNHLMIGLSGSLFALLLIGPQLIRIVGSPLRSGGSIYRSLLLRATLWRQGIEVWSHRPLFGVGLGNYLEYLNTLPAHEVIKLQNTHNTILTPLASVGLLGMIPIVILILSHFRSSLSISKENKHAANIASITVIAILLQGMFIEVLPARWLWLFLAIPIGLAVRERMLERGQLKVKL